MRKISLTAALLFMTMAFFLNISDAQDDVVGPRKTPEFEKKININMVLLDLVVLDKEGNYVHGLSADDFVVETEGKPVDIESVDEYMLTGGDMSKEANRESLFSSPPRTIIFIMDRVFSSTRSITKGKKALQKFILDNFQPGDRGMLLVYNRSFDLVQDITTDPDLMVAAVNDLKVVSQMDDKAEFQEAAGSEADVAFLSPGTEQSNDNPWSLFVDPAKNVRMQAEVRNYFEKLEMLGNALKVLPGKKTVILLSEGYDNRIITTNRVTKFHTAGSPESAGADDPSISSDFSSDTTGFIPTSTLLHSFQQMSAKVNDANTSFYVVDLSSFAGESSRSDTRYQQSLTQKSEYKTKRLEALRNLAETTGGKLYTGSENLESKLDRINYDISNYYILAFTPEEQGNDGDFKKVNIRAKNSDYIVRSRDGYFEPKPFAKLNDEEKLVNMMEGLFLNDPVSEMEAKTNIFFLPVFADSVVASLSIDIPAAELSESGDQSLELLGEVKNSRGRRTDAFHKRIHFGDQMDKIKEEGALRVKVPLLFSTGDHRINVTIRDNESGKRFFYKERVTTRGAQPDDVFMSSVVMFDEEVKESSVSQLDLKTTDMSIESGFGGRRIPDPLRMTNGKSIFPRIKKEYSTDEKPIAFFSIGNYWSDTDNQKVDFYILFSTINNNGEETFVPVIRETINKVPGMSRLNIFSQLDFSVLEPGDHILRVRFLDQMKLQGVERRLAITVQ